MLIVLTQDQEIKKWCQDGASGANQWGTLNIVITTINS